MTRVGPRYRVEFRRKREGKTDYRRRLRLLRSKKPRFVVRISLRHISVQAIQFTPTGDVTKASAHTKDLEKLGFKNGTSNLPAAYLVGLLCGYRSVKSGIGAAVFDIGEHGSTPRGKIFAVLKGAIDSGLEIPHDVKVLPSEDTISGSSISSYAIKLKEKDEKEYRSKFSVYLSLGLNPENISDHFNSIKREIISQFGE